MELVGFILTATAVGFAGFLAVLCAGLYGIRRLVFAAKGEPYVPLLKGSRKRAVKYLDAEGGASADAISRVLRKYLGIDVVGVYAKAGIDALESEQAKSESFDAMLESKFSKGSISWEKFASAGAGVHEAVLRNCAQLANHVQSFDVAEYRAIERAFKRGPWARPNQQPTAAQAERRELFRQTIGAMNALMVANENLLLELGRLTAELGKLDSIDSAESNARIVEEIRTLIDETKYYAQ